MQTYSSSSNGPYAMKTNIASWLLALMEGSSFRAWRLLPFDVTSSRQALNAAEM